jgi:hypothetical protein
LTDHRLDAEVPRESGRVTLRQYGGGPDEGQVIANEAGYLRLGIELLKAAFAPTGHDGEPAAVEVDIAYLVTNNSSINFDWFERRELLEASPSQGAFSLMPVIIILLLASVAMLALIGFITVARWLAAAN